MSSCLVFVAKTKNDSLLVFEWLSVILPNLVIQAPIFSITLLNQAKEKCGGRGGGSGRGGAGNRSLMNCSSFFPIIFFFASLKTTTQNQFQIILLFCYLITLFFFLFHPSCVAYGSSQARDWIWAEWWPMQQLHPCWILNPLCQAKAQTQASAVTQATAVRFLTPRATVETLDYCFL